MLAAGSYRMAAFAKYLPKFGFQPVVFTVALNRLSWNGSLDEFSETNYPIYRLPGMHVGTVISRLFKNRIAGYGKGRQTFRTSKATIAKRAMGFAYDELLTFPDPQWPWYVAGRHQAIKAAKKVRPDIVFSSALPFSSHLLAADIKKKFNIPWVADYRDLWSGFPRRSQWRLSLRCKQKSLS